MLMLRMGQKIHDKQDRMCIEEGEFYLPRRHTLKSTGFSKLMLTTILSGMLIAKQGFVPADTMCTPW